MSERDLTEELELEQNLSRFDFREPERFEEFSDFAHFQHQYNNWEEERQLLLLELEQTRSALESMATEEPDVELLDRINHLEAALEDALLTIDELNNQLNQQQLLEQELVATEQVATMQKEALSHLKEQLAGHQQALEEQLNYSQAKDQSVQELLLNLETLTRTLQIELEKMRLQMLQNRSLVQNGQKQLEKQLADKDIEIENQQQRVVELQAQILSVRGLVAGLELQLVEQEQHIEVLYNRLGDRVNVIKQLEAQIKQTQEALEGQSHVQGALLETQDIVREQNVTISSLYQKIESLENHLTRQTKIQGRLQQSCQELTQQCNDYQARNTEIEKEKQALEKELQKQNEAIKSDENQGEYWQKRYDNANTEIEELKAVIERLEREHSTEIAQFKANAERMQTQHNNELMALKKANVETQTVQIQPEIKIEKDIEPPAEISRFKPNIKRFKTQNQPGVGEVNNDESVTVKPILIIEDGGIIDEIKQQEVAVKPTLIAAESDIIDVQSTAKIEEEQKIIKAEENVPVIKKQEQRQNRPRPVDLPNFLSNNQLKRNS
ncbi:MAG TPA: hypothetical protein V6C58_02840 [Allocoleopsis sp.]